VLWYEVATIALLAWSCIGGLWRPLALALVSAWGLGQAVYLVTDNSLPIALYWVTDAIIICVGLRFYSSITDAIIMALFAVCWYAYATKTGAEQWWWLWWISSVQLLLAGPLPQLQKTLFAVSHGPRRAGI
jgi:hypothetical protein